MGTSIVQFEVLQQRLELHIEFDMNNNKALENVKTTIRSIISADNEEAARYQSDFLVFYVSGKIIKSYAHVELQINNHFL